MNQALEYRLPNESGQSALPNLLRILLLIISPALVLAGIALLIENMRLGPIVEDRYLVSNYVALVWIALGALLLYAAIAQRGLHLTGFSTVAATLLCLLLSEVAVSWANNRPELAMVVSALALIGGIICLSLPRTLSLQSYKPTTGAIAIAVTGATVSVLAAFLLLDRTVRQSSQHVNAMAEMVAHDVQRSIIEATQLLERQAARWQTFDYRPPIEHVELEFNTYIQDINAFNHMAYLDAHGKAVFGRTQNKGKDIEAHRVLDTERGRQWLARVRKTGQTLIEPLAPSIIGPSSLIFIVPLGVTEAGPKGFILAQTDFTSLVNEGFFFQKPPCCFEISAEQAPYVQVLPEQGDRVISQKVRTVALHQERNLQIRYWQDQGSPTNVDLGTLPEVALITGLLFTFATTGSYRLAYVARRRSAQLRQIAQRDPITGLPNRRKLSQMLTGAGKRAVSSETPVSVIFIDVQGIRLVSDTLGHAVGDLLLIEVADRLRLNLPEDASIARLEAGEFVICVEQLDDAEVDALANRLIQLIAKPFRYAERSIRLSAVAGIAAHPPGTRLHEPMALLRQADLAMLQAKRTDTRPWQRFTPSFSARVSEHLALQNDLQTAIESGQLSLHYQPIVCARKGRVSGLEALMRWQHPKLGHVSPDKFIPMAEQSDLIGLLTDWALLTACNHCQRIQDSELPQLPVAVNISPVYFGRSDFIEKIQATLDSTGVPAAMLDLEITENVLMDDLAQAIEKLACLRKMGIQVSLDDFGTGYSSLNYLKQLPIAKIKIDRSFIADVAPGSVDLDIIRGLSEMAHRLGLIVVAEGVETELQFQLLNTINCDQFQGYLFSRPVPFEDLKQAISVAEPVAGGQLNETRNGSL